ncbi:sensor histidine kinase [Agrobacterium sp. SHOUNA12C]|uniref:histidine kinase n=2 Tax=Rhizobium rhizogenes TaxID=359 RepID=B9JG57_RHIR8|nr:MULTISPECIES: sensor histidine kinase [Rhizobium]ACM24840.1 two-component sensor histidine kinase protein [Rhizobium rhizogenes K84]KAA6482759.1 HAMP domain-containing protein [Agrobacterium sp. ICMP 7243]MCJ9724183.1 sensor histidine kinase [Agrobacterium sp. BETTINA12B]MCJ9759907.1 sensor histidine kinase [Agrobacterium sp. SHOUNA12C]OCI91539.1 histidine kinase [Agrobacterium sp. 13-626]OCJ23906.1 histidine kinase [Agrobacterium sp. B131/95]OCJ29926.1 histidine kinase [Agrobacterium sp.
MRTGSTIPFFERAVGLAQLVQHRDRDIDDAETPSGARIARRRWTHPFTLIRRIFGNAVFSSLTRRILFFNLAALVVLVGGILYLNQFREGLIDARVESLLTQGEIIAGAVSASASVDTNSITIDPQKLLELQAGQSITPVPNDEDLEFPIDPEKVAPVLTRLISPTRTRARIFDADANLLLDSRHLYSRGQVLRYDLPPVDDEKQSWSDWFSGLLNKMLQPGNLPVYKEAPGGDGSIYPEVMNALTGVRGAVVRTTEKGELIVSVAVPIQRFRAVLGVLLLSTQAGDIDKIVHAERLAIMRVFGVATLVNVVLSLLLSSTIANPLRRLSAAAIRVRRGGAKEREEIPDFSARQDEIGNLSIALRDMTSALYDRIDAIESFAADVSHELKNPLTSLRSAVETLPLAKSDDSKKRLMDVIQHDVRRLDRLISDISDASRLDAELARSDEKSLDLEVLLRDMIDISRQVGHSKKAVEIEYIVDRKPGTKTKFTANGHDLRIGQIITNLVENARSFVAKDTGKITVRLTRTRTRCVIYIEDNGPGIQAENIDRIFERFYTDRPEVEDFGQNSGLGLSISRQIAEAHGGSLRAENIVDSDGTTLLGARFILSLPAETPA